MITRRTKIQLLVFVLITLLGVSYVGGRYARLDRLVFDDSYTVIGHFQDSGGIFAGGEVSYRGVRVGQVQKLQLTDDGVDVYMDVDKSYDTIPADTLAVVGNRSAVGEQYVELQPQVDTKPYLVNDSEIAQDDTRTPIQTNTILTDLSNTVESVDKPSLKTTVTELGKAFGGTGKDLQRMIDTGNSFIQAANDNFDVTTALIKDSNTVLHGQVDSTTAIKTFARELSLFSGTLAGSNPDLIKLIDNGSVTANQLRTFLEDNRVDLGELVSELVTTGDVIVKHLPGIEQVLVIYPYVVEGGFTVVAKSPDTGLYDAHFGLILTQDPKVCEHGYEGTNIRPPQDGSNAPMNENARCTDPPSQTDPRGAQNAAPHRAPANYRAPVIASYDPASGKLAWGDKVDPTLTSPGTPAPATLGEESWKWLFLQPLMKTQE
ncbi:phospholipid/cholesterol/gamma-HCH transport system substrate-binding protein [Nocardioides ginsengisegetis]|uniref:Phospholipid/cholesterol/gamma-HCH transport system substrate-binding protein n=1 Tax=Nocardioides ginsengisegetis TaxID=661491 RepID=A0A7W3J2D8_9ACTN|nr:phospholipid/cholesterol/gamma-HCH transport system substrate-binding protein [Nocardioides ginsengisegetis]